MATLGVNGSANELWLAVVSDEGEVVTAQNRIVPSADTPLAAQIDIAVEEAQRILTTFGITSVVILEPETGRFQPLYATSVLRISGLLHE